MKSKFQSPNPGPPFWFTDAFVAEISGLRPHAWVCVGEGFSRETFKSELLSLGAVLTGQTLCGIQDITQRIVGVTRARVLGDSARQEGARLLLSNPKIRSHFPELNRLRRQSGFFKKLDRALRTLNRTAAHSEEWSAMLEVLKAQRAHSKAREEIHFFNNAYQAWMRQLGYWDETTLLQDSIERMADFSGDLPQKIYRFQLTASDALEDLFWSALSERVEVETVFSPFSCAEGEDNTPVVAQIERWHSFEDAFEGVAQELAGLPPDQWNSEIFLIPEDPGLRRVLVRSLNKWSVKIKDYRDPSLFKTDETIKKALLPLEVVATDAAREAVVSWVQAYLPEMSRIVVNEVSARGIRRGIKAYSGQKLEPIQRVLSELFLRFKGRLSLDEFKDIHLKIISEANLPPETVKTIWEQLAGDLRQVGEASRKAPALFWLERFKERLQWMSPPTGALHPQFGVSIYRPAQGHPLFFSKTERQTDGRGPRVWVVGLGATWLSEGVERDAVLSARDREILAIDFDIRSADQTREDRKRTLLAWLRGAAQVRWLDAQVNWDGAERESVSPLLRALAPEAELPKVIECGAQAIWRKSYGVLIQAPPTQVRLTQAERELPASALDRYSRCPFQALGQNRWKLEDLREAGPTIWPEARGRILHKAVEKWVLDRSVSLSDAVEGAWQTEAPLGLVQSPRLVSHLKKRMVDILLRFSESENEYRERSGARVWSVEGQHRFESELAGVKVRGVADRIDETEKGFFIIDYKTSSVLPSGKEMMDLGIGLQMPFYGIALRRESGREVLGLQFIQLNSKGNRNRGLFFSAFNGKVPNPLTQVRSNNSSLMTEDPALVWTALEGHVVARLESWKGGDFSSTPAKGPQECDRCIYRRPCGASRRL